MNTSIRLIILFFICCSIDVYGQQTNMDKECEQFISDLLAEMTLEEKVGQMNMYSSFFDVTGPAPSEGDSKKKYEHVKNGMVGAVLNVKGVKEVRKMQELAVNNSRLGIPLLFSFDVIHGFKTTMPIPLAEAASWDLDLIEKSARIAAVEAAAAGLNWTFAPMVDISRDARWGRVMEGAGEDPFLGCKVAEARVRGFQGDDLSSPSTIAACVKHFAAYGFAESGKDYNTADISNSTLFNVVLPPFKAALDAGAATFMNSFNDMNGVPATGDKWLQRDILKGEWGFDGLMVSDWGSITEMIPHGFAKGGEHASLLAAEAGSDMDMESHLYINHLENLVEDGSLDSSILDDAVLRILRLKYKLGLFEDPYKYCDEEREKEVTFSKEHNDFALEMAKNSMVLLKNENNLLPLPKSGKKIAVIGQLANDKNGPLGNWRLGSDDGTAVSVMEGLNVYGENDYTFADGAQLFSGPEHFVFELKINTEDDSGMDKAIDLAKSSDVVIMVLGEHGYQSGEGRSRSDIGLPGMQQELLEKVMAVNENVVLVLMHGRPLAIEWADEHVPAIISAWQLGTQSGHAIAQVLFGDHNPSGKLPMCFPRDVGQIPIYYNYKNTGRPGPISEVFWSHYSDLTNDPLYDFGYGLSYTKFKYSDFNVVNTSDKKVRLSVTVTNTGDHEGAEVVQFYMRDMVASNTRPVKELKAFEKVSLGVGESTTLKVDLDRSHLGFFNNQGVYVYEPGEFTFMVSEFEKLIEINGLSKGIE